ncbi:LysR family transcriptional regulator [Paenibacillus faecalis]|uniref:LysR family transcriptional regulator n=1 Tax=Paenibacillus faecalis TaxID=2079532 RepID=UPI000D0E59C9|nr:LysR family transcriptional regulator [Paenibacillus faecalis]
MNLDQLYYIIEVAKTKSLSTAANNLHITQSAVSQSIANLEFELGLQLFVRSRAGAVPTKEGLEIIKKAADVVAMLQDMKDGALKLSEMMHAELRISAIPGVMSTLIKTVSSFKREYPSITFQINERGSEKVLDEIRHNQVDIGLIGMSQDSEPIGPGMIFEPIWEGKMVVAVGKSSSLASRKRVTPEEMRNYLFALYDETYVHDFVHYFNEMHGPLDLFFISNNPFALTTALKENLAATIGYDFSFINSPSILNGDFVTLEMDGVKQKPIELGWARADTNKVSQLSQMFIQRFLHYFNTNQLTS